MVIDDAKVQAFPHYDLWFFLSVWGIFELDSIEPTRFIDMVLVLRV